MTGAAENLERERDSGQWHGGPIAAIADTVGDYALMMLLGRPSPTVNFRVDIYARRSAPHSW
jgi:acyl-coenzyme A thioesterase PaaI-like protein